MEAQMNQDPPADILDAIAPIYQSIWDVAVEAWTIWHRSHLLVTQTFKHYRPRNRAIGADMSDILRASFREKCEADLLTGVEFVEQGKLWFIIINKAIAIRFNLMNKNGITIHSHTEQAEKYRDGQLEIEGFEELTFLYGGYILDDSKSEIANLYVLKRDADDTPVWVIQRHHVTTQIQIPFSMPARVVKPQIEEKRPRRTSAKKVLGDQVQPNQLKTGTNDA